MLTDPAPHPHLRTLLEVTAIPTASGHESRVIAYIKSWAAARKDLRLSADRSGNLVVALRRIPGKKGPPLFITAHLDHPAFVVERVVAPGTLELSFRGGVNEVYFENAPITLHLRNGRTLNATLCGKAPSSSPAGQHYLAEIADSDAQHERLVRLGDIATWLLLPPEIDDQGVVHTAACDDLSAVAAALCAMDELRTHWRAAGKASVRDVRLLFTRAEEIGFIGAIGAVKHRSMPRGSRVLALENSRAFPDCPLGAGPVVRVGDRLSVFTPWLTQACAQRAEQLFGGPSTPTASQTAASGPTRKWQRKLMAGGACEASVFCAAGYDATCLCLPLGNYHNMAHLDAVQAGTYDASTLGPPRCAREFIHSGDYLSLIDLLVGLGINLPVPGELNGRFAKLFADKGYVLTTAARQSRAKRPSMK